MTCSCTRLLGCGLQFCISLHSVKNIGLHVINTLRLPNGADSVPDVTCIQTLIAAVTGVLAARTFPNAGTDPEAWGQRAGLSLTLLQQDLWFGKLSSNCLQWALVTSVGTGRVTALYTVAVVLSGSQWSCRAVSVGWLWEKREGQLAGKTSKRS